MSCPADAARHIATAARAAVNPKKVTAWDASNVNTEFSKETQRETSDTRIIRRNILAVGIGGIHKTPLLEEERHGKGRPHDNGNIKKQHLRARGKPAKN